MANLSKVIYINEVDYSTLLNGGTITKGGVTYSHDPTALYVIKNVSAPEYAETAGYATTAGQATKATQDGGGNVISETYAKKAVVGTLTNNNNVWSCDKTHKELTNAILAGNLVYLTAPNWNNQAYYPKKYPYPDGNGNYNRDLQFQSLESGGSCEIFGIHNDNSIENEEIDFESYLNGEGYFKQRIILKLTIGNNNTLSFKDQDNQNIDISGANWLIRYSQDEKDVVIQYNNREYRKQTYESNYSRITFVSIDLENYLLYYLSFNCSTSNTITLIENTFIPILPENVNLGQAYGVSSDNSNAIRTSSISGFKLKKGGIVAIKFTTDINITNPSLNISSTGAKPIYYRGSTLLRGTINAGDTVTFIYDGTYYHVISIDKNIPDPATTAPLMDGTAAVGSSTKYAKEDHVHPSDTSKANVADLAAVATSGSYNDLADKPTIPAAVTVDSTITQNGTNPVQGGAIYSALQEKAGTVYYSDIDEMNADETQNSGTLAFVDDGSGFHIWSLPDMTWYKVVISDDLDSYVPTARKINNKSLSSDITLNASDVGALPSNTHIPADQVQSNWNETNTSSKAYIQNKPTIPDTSILATKTELNAKQDKINDLATIRSGAGKGATSVQTISVNEGTPMQPTNGNVDITIPSAAWADVKPSGGVPKSDLASGVQTSLGKADSAIQGVKVNGTELTPDADKKVSISVVTGLQFDGSSHVGAVQLPEYVKKSDYDTAIAEYVKKSDYDTTIDDIYQSIPSDLADLADDETHRVVTDAEKSTWDGKQNTLTFDSTPTASSTNPVTSGGIKTYVDGKASITGITTSQDGTFTITLSDGNSYTVNLNHVHPQYVESDDLADVATSGSYNDLTDKPVIPEGADLSGYYTKTEIDNKGFITTETDPTVPSWAKASSKPSYTASEVGAVPTTRKVNNKALSSDITLTASDVGAVPTTRTINGKALSSNITLSASDIGADAFIVNITSSNGIYISDKTYSQITTAYNSKRNVFAVHYGAVYQLIQINNYGIRFVNFSQMDVEDRMDVIYISASDSISYDEIYYQRGLISGTNIKTINNQSLLGSGNIEIESGGTVTVENVTDTGDVVKSLEPNIFYKFGTVDSLTIPLIAGTELAVYAGKFTISSSSTASSFLVVPSTVTVAYSCPTISVGNTYEFSIADNVLLMAEV